MRLLVMAIAVLALAAPALAEDWNNVAMVDVMCSAKAKSDPDAHTRDCALQCQKSGFGIVTAGGEFLKLDDAGNQQAIALLKSSNKKDHLRVNVSGERSGDQVKVKSLKLS